MSWSFLGTRDDLVPPDDTIDFAADFSGNFQLIEVKQTGHYEAIVMTAPEGPRDKRPSAHRWEMFSIALNDEGIMDGIAGLARAPSSIPTTPGHSHEAVDGAVHSSGQY